MHDFTIQHQPQTYGIVRRSPLMHPFEPHSNNTSEEGGKRLTGFTVSHPRFTWLTNSYLSVNWTVGSAMQQKETPQMVRQCHDRQFILHLNEDLFYDDHCEGFIVQTGSAVEKSGTHARL